MKDNIWNYKKNIFVIFYVYIILGRITFGMRKIFVYIIIYILFSLNFEYVRSLTQVV